MTSLPSMLLVGQCFPCGGGCGGGGGGGGNVSPVLGAWWEGNASPVVGDNVSPVVGGGGGGGAMLPPVVGGNALILYELMTLILVTCSSIA